MKRTVIYWCSGNAKRKAEVRAALGITSESVNGESEYRGDVERLNPYVEEGLITIRIKEYEQEIRRKKVRFDPKQGQPVNSKAIGRGGRKRKV